MIKYNKNATWSLDGGYNIYINTSDAYPHRTFGSGKHNRLETSFRIFKDDLSFTCGRHEGLKVFLHAPGDEPQINSSYIEVQPNEGKVNDIFLLVKPNVMTTSEGLRDYAPKHRKCFYTHERKLLFFKNYTQNHCQWECLTNHTKTACGCVRFTMPSYLSTF